MADRTMTVLENLQAGTAWLEKKGVPEARRNMEYLLAHVLGVKRLDLYLQFDRPLGEVELAPLRELLRRRGTREPLQHLLGTVQFAGRTFRVDRRALVPRPETEELALRLLKDGPGVHGGCALDMGCGSGVLGLTLAAAWAAAGWTVVLADASDEAIALAGENRAALGVAESAATLVASDLFASLTGSFDLVVANLPYVDHDEMAALQPEVRFDPAGALDGGEGGVAVIRRFVDQLPGRLNPGARLAMEVGAGQGAGVAGWLEASGLADVRCESDGQCPDRFVMARWPERGTVPAS